MDMHIREIKDEILDMLDERDKRIRAEVFSEIWSMYQKKGRSVFEDWMKERINE